MDRKLDQKGYSPILRSQIRRRPGQTICYALFMVFLVGFFGSRGYSTRGPRGNRNQWKAITVDDITTPTHTHVRYYDPESKHIFPDYRYERTLGRGFEGSAEIYTHIPSGQLVVLKRFFYWTAMERTPQPLQDILQSKYNYTAIGWPRELVATLHDYSSESYPDTSLISYAIDAFYVPYPPDTWLPPDDEHPADQPWRLVFPYYPSADLQSSLSTFRYLNFTLDDLDYLYRPRFRTIFEALARLHTAAVPDKNITGYCHDDVKLDNIFHIDEAMHTILADMGQTRPMNHTHHKSWTDCRIADAHRAWKTYLLFLRHASSNPYTFDAAFMIPSAAWADAYWSWRDSPQTPGEMLTANDGLWGPPLPERNVLVPQWNWVTRRVGRVAMTRDLALQAVEAVRREAKKYKDVEKKSFKNMPWWWWKLPSLPQNEGIERELKVYGGHSHVLGTNRPPKRAVVRKRIREGLDVNV